MSIFVGFPKIGQFRNVVQGLTMHERYAGRDETGEPIYDSNRLLPKLVFNGTVKLHGTNAGFGLYNDEVWFQSRTSVITPVKDNAGFAAAFSGADKLSYIKQTLEGLKNQHNVDDDKVVVMFGEWCGGSIQKGVALNQLDKRFVLFGIRVVGHERNDDGNYTYDEWLPISGVSNHEIGFYNVEDYERYELSVNLNDPKASLNSIENLVKAVEAECPFSKAFGISGLGEGIVWTTLHKGTRYAFKTKGEKHANVRQKKPASVDPEKVNNVAEFISYSVTENRLNQAIEQVFTTQSIEPSIKGTGLFLKWLVNDIVTEEIDTLSANGLCAKDVNGSISKAARTWFFEYLDKLVF
jgi:hypothetical protein